MAAAAPPTPPVTGGGGGDNPQVVLISNLDAGNPLHVHNSDNSSSVLVPFKLLGTENYRMWNNAMKLALQARNKYGFVDGTCLKESYAESDVLCAQWDRCNAMVLTWIMNVVSSDVYMGLVYSENAADVWKELSETYDKVDGSIVYNLIQKIRFVKQGGSTVADYYHKLNSFWREFDAIAKVPKYVCLVKCACVVRILFYVKDSYDTVSREESYRGIPETSETIDSKLNATSFAVKTFNQNKRGNNNTSFNRNNNNYNRGNGSNNNRGPNPNLLCKNCGFTGHTIERCYELIGYPPGYKKPNAPKQNGFRSNFNANSDTKGSDKQPSACNSPTSFTADQMQKLLNLINDSTSGNTQSNMAGRVSFFNGNAWFNVNFSKFYCGNSKFLVKTITLGWIIDSGANQHLTTSTIGMINVVDISNLNITVGHPNGTVATISHIGDLRLSNNVILHDVLVVPGYCVSLLSVNKLIKDSKLFVGFDEDKCYIQDLVKGITLGTGSESGGLYLFDDNKKKCLGNSNNVMAFNVSKDFMHCRICHPSWTKFLNSQTDNEKPFPLSDHKSVKLGELVHLDLWGPYKVSSREGFKFFLTIVDDFSRALWTYLLKIKDEVFEHIKIFSLFADLGIIHQTSCPHTPQQNGIAERKHRHLLNVARSLMFQGGIPLNFWSDCILTAVFLINRLPSSVLSDKSHVQFIPDSSRDNSEEVQPSVRRSSRPSKLPAKLNDFVLDSKLKYGIEKHVNYSKLNNVNYCFATTLNKSVEPTNYYEAIKDPRWVEAMNLEIEALTRNNTWTLTDLPHGRKAIANKWLYKIKYKSSGLVDKFKARVVAKGFSQREGIDFDETFSPVVKMVTVRCLICIAVSNDWPLSQLDVNNAFLYGDLNEDIYMSLPLGFECADKNKVCKLNKALYGLKQAPRQWNAKLTTVLVEHGFVQSKFDYSLYIKHSNDLFVALLVYVDDFIITGNNIDEIKNFKSYLKSKFMIKDLGAIKYFLGIEILDNSNVTTPLLENYVLAVNESDSDKSLKNIFEYQKLLGKLIYLTYTRPDISYDVHCLSQHMHTPLQSHLRIALKVIRYLKNSPRTGIQIFKDKNLKLCCFTDADWAKCLRTKKSVSGLCVFFRKSFHGKARNKPLYPDPLQRLSIDAWLVPLVKSCGRLISWVDVHFIREKVQDGVINTIKVDYADQTANILTKGLGPLLEFHEVRDPLLLSGERWCWTCSWAYLLMDPTGVVKAQWFL
ncbi:ribonuclease H-like domain-containing protein [Tanacetum coccineum]